MEVANPIKNKYDSQTILDQRFSAQIAEFCSKEYSIDYFDELVGFLQADDIIKQHQGIIGIRKLISNTQNPPIWLVLQSKAIQRIMVLVKQDDYAQLQCQAAWVLVNICSGTSQQCQAIYKLGVINIFIGLLSSTHLAIVYHGIWGISNLASDSAIYRDQAIKEGAVPRIIKIAKQFWNDLDFLSNCCWSLSNICRCKPVPKYGLAKLAISFFCEVLTQGKAKDQSVISDCCWAISYYSDSAVQIDELIKLKMVPTLLQNIKNPALQVMMPSMRILGNITTGKDAYSNELVQAGLLQAVEPLLSHPRKVVRRQICWALSNIATCNQVMLNMDNLMNKLVWMLENEENEVKKEVCYVFAHLTNNAEPSSIFGLFTEKGVMKHFVELLKTSDKKLLGVILDSIIYILEYAEQFKINQVNIISQELLKWSADQILKAIFITSKGYTDKIKQLLGFLKITVE